MNYLATRFYASSLTALSFLLPLAIATSATGSDSFLRKYCFDCHDNRVETAGLSLESLTADFLPKDLHRTWVRVHDRIRDGEMPPKGESQPSNAERAAFLNRLEGQLHAASLQQQQQGRVTIRRLSRGEYENTVRDLLGIGINLKSYLPEDNVVAGFDNVSPGLETSATHLVRYQDAADAALSEALPPKITMPESVVWRSTGRAWLEQFPKIYHNQIVPWSKVEGDDFVYRALLNHDTSPRTPRTSRAGLYRIRASVRARNNGGHAIPVEFGRLSVDRFGRQDLEHLIGIQDAVEEESRIITAEAMLIQNESLYISPRRMQKSRGWPKDRPKPTEKGFEGAELVLEWFEFEGPLDVGNTYEDFFGGFDRVPDRFLADVRAGKKQLPDWSKWHPNEFRKPHNRLRLVTDTPREDAKRLIGVFLERAIRRPPSTELLAYYRGRAEKMFDEGKLLDEVLLRVYKEILCSPQFLLRLEKPGKLDDFALASRLSYFLWNSMPDDELLKVAARGELHDPEVLHAQTQRLLKHRKAQRFVNSFTGQWLDLAKIHEMKPDKLYKEYDEALAWSMPEETRLFFAEVLNSNLPVTEFVDSDWTFLNDRLALHYGIDGVDGMSLRRVNLPKDAHRGGLLTHASILKLTTNSSYTSPIMRGAWVLERIVGTPPSPPPPNIEAIEPDIRGAVTLREQMKLHKSQSVCASCHVKIDPPGFALENYDVLGGWRERYRVAQGGAGIDYQLIPNHPKPDTKGWYAKPVLANGNAVDGTAFHNFDDYKKILLRDPDQLARNLAEKLLVYGTGGTLEFADRRAVEKIVAAARADQYRFRTLLHAVVQSSVFRKK